ncbi:DinB family protein [Ferruginibacter sp. HRS2-29]|uniref:DinB family protein n=1 Tax=Ferruginibacter sp. HRS2-29 TaxID=2487334 RepID=UPI0020CDBCE1|nr:DinB family protein [Ferruginibacter sp. HRS2-29]MCP9752404.1 DinB family protein [Ferruginibacter sp. HRS2-29]
MGNQQLFIQMAITAWKSHNKRVDELLNTLTDEQLATPTAPGRNSGVYLLGHLAAVNDNLFVLLGFGERLHPELDLPFLQSPDGAGLSIPDTVSLRKYWEEINSALSTAVDELSTEGWFEKHSAVSSEDFAKEPHRNKLNILLNRTNHQAYHLGQMNYLKTK